MKPITFMKACLSGCLFAILALPFPDAGAQGTEPPAVSVPAVDHGDIKSSAPVVIDGNFLFKVGGIEAYPATRRADEIRKRIVELAKDPAFSVDSLEVREEPHATALSAGGRPILTIFDSDSRLLGMSREATVRIALIKIREAVEQYRIYRRPENLRRSAVYAAGATVVFIALMLLLLWVFKKTERWMEGNYKFRSQGLKVGSVQLIQAERIFRLYQGLLGSLRLLLFLLLFYFYLEYALSRFPWTRGIAAHLLGLILDPVKRMAQATLEYLPSLAFLVVLALVAFYALKLIRVFFNGLGQGAVTVSGFESEWAKPTYSLVRVLVIAFAVVVAYPYIPGSESDAFKGVSIFLGLLVSLGSTSAISNIIAGYTMIYRRTFKIGDRIRIGEHTGDVTAMRLLTTELQTIKNERIVVPNSQILNSSVVNYSTLAKEKGLILHTSVGIGYETPWRQVDAMLKIAADRTPGLLKEPPPFVLKTALGDFAVSYEINAFCEDPKKTAQVYADLHENILEQFNEYGVQIMTPAYEGDPESPKVPPKDRWYAAPADRFFKNDGGKTS